MSQEKLSFTFRVCHKLGIVHDSEKYGKISIFGILTKIFKTLKIAYYFKNAYTPGLFHTRDFN